MRMNKWMYLLPQHFVNMPTHSFHKNLLRIYYVPGSAVCTGIQSEQDWPAPCFQRVYVLVREIADPQGNKHAPDFRRRWLYEENTQGYMKWSTWSAGWLEDKGSREGPAEKVAIELWLWRTVKALLSSAYLACFKCYILENKMSRTCLTSSFSWQWKV